MLLILLAKIVVNGIGAAIEAEGEHDFDGVGVMHVRVIDRGDGGFAAL